MEAPIDTMQEYECVYLIKINEQIGRIQIQQL